MRLIQACHSFDGLGTKDRELRALVEASEELRCDDRLVVTDNLFLPLWKWLLEGS